MKNIIGRGLEIKYLSEYLNSGKSEFVVIYGRRRVGKTFLVREFFDNKFTFTLSGAENVTKEVQLFNFNAAINKYSHADYPLVDNWQSAFSQLENYLDGIKRAGRKVIFIDEMPWLDNTKSGFLSAFEYFWNTYGSARKDIFLVVCGSATSWIMQKVIKSRGGLHNRVTRQICLAPFTLNETEQFIKSKKLVMNRFQIAECYMIMGGVPYYWEQLERSLSLSQNIDNLFFMKNAVLRTEYSKLYASLFKKPAKYTKIVEVLAQKRKGLTRDEIVALSHIPDGGGLTDILEELELCGFIAINDHFENQKKNKLYQLVDFYSLFYLSFVKKKKTPNSNYWSSLLDNIAHKAWSGYSFELLCQMHVWQIQKALGISGVHSDVSGWRSKTAENGAQIDLLIDRNDNIINLCEMKYANKEFVITKSQDANLRNKRAAFIEESKTRKTVHITLVTTYGVKHNEYWNNIQSEITLDDLFAS